MGDLERIERTLNGTLYVRNDDGSYSTVPVFNEIKLEEQDEPAFRLATEEDIRIREYEYEARVTTDFSLLSMIRMFGLFHGIRIWRWWHKPVKKFKIMTIPKE